MKLLDQVSIDFYFFHKIKRAFLHGFQITTVLNVMSHSGGLQHLTRNKPVGGQLLEDIEGKKRVKNWQKRQKKRKNLRQNWCKVGPIGQISAAAPPASQPPPPPRIRSGSPSQIFSSVSRRIFSVNIFFLPRCGADQVSDPGPGAHNGFRNTHSH